MSEGRAARAPVLVTPPAPTGLRIGLFGGSFNPAHAGHLHVAETALRRLDLDCVWWLVSPGNPLKSGDGLPPLADRMAQAQEIARDPRIIVTDIEAQLGTRYTCDLLQALRRERPEPRFVWLMGADNLRDFHNWKNWQTIAGLVPIAVIDRPGATQAALASPTAHWMAKGRLREEDAAVLAQSVPPAWVFLHGPLVDLSSSALRKETKPLE